MSYRPNPTATRIQKETRPCTFFKKNTPTIAHTSTNRPIEHDRPQYKRAQHQQEEAIIVGINTKSVNAVNAQILKLPNALLKKFNGLTNEMDKFNKSMNLDGSTSNRFNRLPANDHDKKLNEIKILKEKLFQIQQDKERGQHQLNAIKEASNKLNVLYLQLSKTHEKIDELYRVLDKHVESFAINGKRAEITDKVIQEIEERYSKFTEHPELPPVPTKKPSLKPPVPARKDRS